MNINLSKIIIFLIVLISFLNLSCEKAKDKIAERVQRDRLIATDKDTLFKREWMRIEFQDNRIEEIEIYISENNDTISNQYKLLINNEIDTIKSHYYDLKITKTKNPNIYNGQITLHTKYKNLKLNEQNSRKIEFAYCNQNKDSVFIRYVESETSNTINFQFENHYGNRLQGQLYQLVLRDTIINNEEMVNLNQSYIIVDNQVETVNFFLDSEYINEHRFKLGNLKLTKKK